MNAKKMKTYGFVLLCDSILWLALLTELVLFDYPSFGRLPGLWTFVVIKWALIKWLAAVLFDGNLSPVLCRFVALVSLLPPVFESGRMLVGRSLFNGGSLPEPSTIALAHISSIVACLLWEKVFTGGQISKEMQHLDTRALLQRVFIPDLLYLILAFAFLIVPVVCDAIIPLFQGRVINMLRGQINQTRFLNTIGWLALLTFGSSLFAGLRGGTFKWLLARLNRRMKCPLYHNLLEQDMHFFEGKGNEPGKLASRLHNDVNQMGILVAWGCNALVRSTIKSAIMLTLMAQLSWRLMLLTIVDTSLLGLIHIQYATYTKEYKDQMQDCQAETMKLASQTINDIRVVRSFKAEHCEVKRYNKALDKMNAIKRRKGIYSAVVCLMQRLVYAAMKFPMLVEASSLISSGHITLGDLLAFLLYRKPLIDNMKEFVKATGEMVSTVGVINKVFGYLDRKPTCKPAGQLAPDKLEGRITFSDVSFAYPSTPDTLALKHISMELSPGKMTAVVGPTGGGKSSCVSLLKRLYEPQKGQILLDGQPLHCYKHKYLHQKVAVIPQNPGLFSGSFRYNIGYGLKNCTIEMLEEAARKASVNGFIASLDDRYDTDIGECGKRLAAGQNQCIAIARALVRMPRVVILDEATSQLDVDIQLAVVREVLQSGLTLLVVTHQLKMVEMAAHVIYIEDGAIVEEGTHKELMDKKGHYHQTHQGLFD